MDLALLRGCPQLRLELIAQEIQSIENELASVAAVKAEQTVRPARLR